jgi:signal transduction histidine kinase
MSLKRALLILTVTVLAAGTIPAGIVAYGRLARALDSQVRESLAMAPELLDNRWTATVDVRMMHARDVARTPGLAEALQEGRPSEAARMVEQAGATFPEAPLLVGPDGKGLIPTDSVPPHLLEATRRGEMPVEVVPEGHRVRVVSLAPIRMDERWLGAAGGTSVMGASEAATLAGLTRTEVLILTRNGQVAAASVPEDEAGILARGLLRDGLDSSRPPAEGPETEGILETSIDGIRYLALSAPLAGDARVVFLKNLDRELSVLPLLRRIALWSGGITLVLAVLMGTLFAGRLARPVASLADASQRLADGDFQAPVESSGIREFSKVSESFHRMRTALRTRLAELEEANVRLAEANRELEDRQERLVVLQGELVQRDRLASAGRLLSQLAHEIRNPVASIRNCLEVLRRRVSTDSEAREFADMAIDELLRMHELTEQMMEVHRPRDPESSSCRVADIAREVATLLKAAADPGAGFQASVVGSEDVQARMAPDALKQVLLTLGSNAREAMEDGGPVEFVIREGEDQVRLDVLDRGPGIPREILPRIFDPFFTTKSRVQGVGLGLFTAEAVVRTYGGSIEATNREDGPGARFTIQMPLVRSAAGEPTREARSRGDEAESEGEAPRG